jgi:hypothetical protein
MTPADRDFRNGHIESNDFTREIRYDPFHRQNRYDASAKRHRALDLTEFSGFRTALGLQSGRDRTDPGDKAYRTSKVTRSRKDSVL